MSMVDHDDQDRAREAARRRLDREAAIRRAMPYGPADEHVVVQAPTRTAHSFETTPVVLARREVEAYRVISASIPEPGSAFDPDYVSGVVVRVPTQLLERYEAALAVFREAQREFDRLYHAAKAPPGSPPAYTL